MTWSFARSHNTTAGFCRRGRNASPGTSSIALFLGHDFVDTERVLPRREILLPQLRGFLLVWERRIDIYFPVVVRGVVGL